MYDKHFPFEVPKKKKRKLKSWMTDGLLQSVKYKHKLYAKYLHNPSVENETKYKKFRNFLNSLTRQIKIDFYKDKFQQCKHNIKDTWQVINSLIKEPAKKDENCMMNCNGEMSNDPTKIANSFNRFFVDVGPSLAKQIPPIGKVYGDYLKEPIINSIFLSPVTEHEIIKIVTAFNNNKASGIDGIDFSPKVIKLVIGHISKPLCHIFNLCLLNGNFPDKLKLAKVSPIFKKGDKQVLSNNRPISVLSVFSKILERIIYDRIYKFIDQNNILFKNQYGFRKNYSTSMALLEVANTIADAFESNSYSLGVFIDLSKAFDTINHEILLSKVYHYGIRGTAHDLLANYLTNRQQCTKYMTSKSDFSPITCGVPQGSLLGPLLFLLYINDIHMSSNILSYFLYADDTTIVYSDSNLEKLYRVVNDNLDNVFKWFSANKLSVNLKKCNYILFRNSNRTIDLASKEIKLNDVVLPRVEETKFLGVFIECRLSWKSHIYVWSNQKCQRVLV